MLSGWPIRKKLIVGIILLFGSLTILAFSGIKGVYAFRALARGMSRRAAELPIAVTLAQHTSALEATVRQSDQVRQIGPASIADTLLEMEFDEQLAHIERKLGEYRAELNSNQQTEGKIGQIDKELTTAGDLANVLDDIRLAIGPDVTFPTDQAQRKQLAEQVQYVNALAAKLPSFLQERMNDFAGDVRVQYRTWIVLAWSTTVLAVSLVILSMFLLRGWVFRPLQQIIEGSRHVAGGNFDYRIQLKSDDEMAELARAMNHMTARFQEIRDDLDNQVQQRTKEVVRSEQLASVGFLAAGVAHEINNPLASIALCAESLEDRIRDIIPLETATSHDDTPTDACGDQVSNNAKQVRAISEADAEVLRDYLRMIQDEAFRCKGITERLLDFSRLSDVEKSSTDLSDLVSGVIDTVRHVGKYRDKHVSLKKSNAVYVPINAQEIKQVVLNLITNGLDSLDAGGQVSVRVDMDASHAILIVTDNGCGMTPEIREHIFEPFFTRRRDGQGTGLGMSISYRIVTDHGGDISVRSDGPGKGSQFIVRLPLQQPNKNTNDRKTAA